MKHKQRKVVTSSSSISSCSLQCSPVQHPKTFLANTLVPKTTLLTWKQGISTPIHEGNLTPNQMVVELLAGFSTGKIQMQGDTVEHMPSSEADESIADMLSQLDSATHHKDQGGNNSAFHISPIVMITRLQAEKILESKYLIWKFVLKTLFLEVLCISHVRKFQKIRRVSVAMGKN